MMQRLGMMERLGMKVKVIKPATKVRKAAHEFERISNRGLEGYFCPTPENVKSVERGFAQVLERFTPVYGISVSSNQGINVYF
jgi:hypothetical protein